MKQKIKNIEKEIRSAKKAIKREQKFGGKATYCYLNAIRKDIRELCLAQTLIKKKVSLDDVSIKKILEYKIEIKSEKKKYIEPDIGKIKEHMIKSFEKQKVIDDGGFNYECLYSYKVDEEIEVKTKTIYKGKEDIEIDGEEALAVLLINGMVFLNAPWWMKEWPEEARNSVGVHVNCNDVFAWGASDAETLEYKDLDSLFEHFIKDEIWGTAVWCIRKRGFYPQKQIYNSIQALGKWDLDKMNLKKGVDGKCE